MRFSRWVGDGGRGGRRPSGTGRRGGSDVMNRDVTAEILGKWCAMIGRWGLLRDRILRLAGWFALVRRVWCPGGGWSAGWRQRAGGRGGGRRGGGGGRVCWGRGWGRGAPGGGGRGVGGEGAGGRPPRVAL